MVCTPLPGMLKLIVSVPGVLFAHGHWANGRMHDGLTAGTNNRTSAEPAARSRSLEPGAWSQEPGAKKDQRMNIQQIMKQAQQAQDRLQKQMAELRVEGAAGGGMVTVVINGAKQIQSIKIDPEVVSKEDVGMLQDLIVAAINDAHRKVDDEMKRSMGGMMSGLNLPGL